MRPSVSLVVLLLVVLAGPLLASCGFFYGPVDSADSAALRFTVPRGAVAVSLGSALEQAGLVRDERLWKLYLKTSGKGACLKAGDFWLRRDMSLPTIMETLCGAPIPDDLPFTVVEGWRIADIDAALSDAQLAAPGEYSRLASQPAVFHLPFPVPGSTLEGFLFPDTYMVSPGHFQVKTLLEKQLANFTQKFWEVNKGILGRRSLHDVVVVASLVEREEPDPSKRPLVAGIIWKRLDKGWNLGVDATSRYTLADWNDRASFLRKLKDPADPYNTRLRRGLPPTAIGNPSLSALTAAVQPTASEYWYYLHDRNKQVHFARNGREHEANRRRYQVW